FAVKMQDHCRSIATSADWSIVATPILTWMRSHDYRLPLVRTLRVIDRRGDFSWRMPRETARLGAPRATERIVFQGGGALRIALQRSAQRFAHARSGARVRHRSQQESRDAQRHPAAQGCG